MTTYCCYESTFIAVKDEAPPRRSSHSAPPTGERPERAETGARNYVESLEARAACIIELHGAREDHEEELEQDMQIDAPATKEPPSLTTSVQGNVPTQEEAYGQKAVEPNNDHEALSQGSWGHPELCRKPCLFLRFGNCPNGAQCEYCHVPHNNRAVKLDKRQRDSLKELSEAALLGLLLPHLHARVAKMSLPQEAKVTLGFMEQYLASLPHEAEGHTMPAWKLNQLNRLLRQMSFMRLVRLTPCSDVDDVKDALSRLQLTFGASTQGDEC
mmetsp:Transcript_18773/g.35230  ORF Transcript_18773/g.35230 Transcript_18773/m.35230 type:complete len:271 (+) Transcript_18773:65-877(+)